MVTLVLVTTTLAGFLGAAWWGFDLVANLRPQQAILLTLLVVVLLHAGSRLASAVAAIGAVVNLMLVAPLLVVADPAAHASESATLDIVFLNVKIDLADRQAVMRHLHGRDDDLVILAAGTRSWVERLEDTDLGLHVVAGPGRGRDLELIVLARDPDALTVVHQRTDDSRSALVEIITELDGEPVRVLATHAVSPLTPPRARQRDAHLAWVAAWAQEREEPVVVVGDLNATPWSSSFRALLEHGGLRDSQEAHGLQASWPARLGTFGLPIDHVLHSPELITVDRELGPSFGSEHRMVHARLSW